MDSHLRERLGPLVQLDKIEVASPARGILFQIQENLGIVLQKNVKNLLKNLSETDRKRLSKLGLRFGTEILYFPELLKPKATELLSVLWRVSNSSKNSLNMPKGGQVTIQREQSVAAEYYNAIGFIPLGKRAVRADILERVAVALRRQSRKQPFVLEETILSLLGLGYDETALILRAMGYIEEKSASGERLLKRANKKRKTNFRKSGQLKSKMDKIKTPRVREMKKNKSRKPNPDSPFAILKNFQAAKSG